MEALKRLSRFAGDTFAVGVILFAVLAFFAPSGFSWIVPYISLLLGIVMFGMGMTLSVDDFREVLRQPKHVAIGVIAQFTIMPLLAYALAVGLRLSPEVAAGVILVGCCPGGTASNVMTYLAKGNVPLSVAMTSVSTLLASLLTPTLVLLLASKWLPVAAGEMFLSVVKIIVIPLGLGVIAKMIFRKQVEASIHALPLVSVVAIVAIVSGVVGANQAKIAEAGLLILLVVVLHNGLGYLLGYWTARLLKLGQPEVKAISIEVSMQNSGLGAALAAAHFSPLAAVPSAIFSVVHNLSGSLLASWWGRKAKDGATPLAAGATTVSRHK